MASGLIDVWDIRTFDGDLGRLLATAADVVRDYMTAARQIFLAHDLGHSPGRYRPRPENPSASAFFKLESAIGQLMCSRTIRAWHYTRLTSEEVDKVLHEGIHLSTPATLRHRLDFLVSSGKLNAQMAKVLYAESPFHSEQKEIRSDKFWMVSHPVAVHDPGVVPLMARWGGEVASMWTKDPVLLGHLVATGMPRILEIAVPLAFTRQSYWAGQAVVATFARSLGCIPEKHCFDLYVTAPLPSDSVLRVHSEGDPSFHAMGLTYPQDYIDVDIGYWKELTGEDD